MSPYMTIGTATVARTKVRRTGDNGFNQSPSTRFRTVRVGKTASQIISASWCFVGGEADAARAVRGWSDIGTPEGVVRWVGMGAARQEGRLSGEGAGAEVADGTADVVVDEVAVEG